MPVPKCNYLATMFLNTKKADNQGSNYPIYFYADESFSQFKLKDASFIGIIWCRICC